MSEERTCPAGHPAAAIVSSDEGTSYCQWCQDVGRAAKEARATALEEAVAIASERSDWLGQEIVARIRALPGGPER